MSRPLRIHPGYQGFTATTSRSASRRRNGTQRLTVPAARRAPSHLPPARTGRQYQRPPSHVPRESRRPGSRRLHAGHRLANTRAPARLVLKQPQAPQFRCRLIWFRHFDSGSLSLAFLIPTWRIRCAFSSSLTTTVFSQRSMRWFDASPRRATPKGHKSFIFHAAPHRTRSPTWWPRSPRSWRTGVPEVCLACELLLW